MSEGLDALVLEHVREDFVAPVKALRPPLCQAKHGRLKVHSEDSVAAGMCFVDGPDGGRGPYCQRASSASSPSKRARERAALENM